MRNRWAGGTLGLASLRRRRIDAPELLRDQSIAVEGNAGPITVDAANIHLP